MEKRFKNDKGRRVIAADNWIIWRPHLCGDWWEQDGDGEEERPRSVQRSRSTRVRESEWGSMSSTCVLLSERLLWQKKELKIVSGYTRQTNERANGRAMLGICDENHSEIVCPHQLASKRTIDRWISGPAVFKSGEQITFHFIETRERENERIFLA